MRVEIRLDQALLKMIESSGDSSVFLQAYQTYDLLIPADVWNDNLDALLPGDVDVYDFAMRTYQAELISLDDPYIPIEFYRIRVRIYMEKNYARFVERLRNGEALCSISKTIPVEQSSQPDSRNHSQDE